MERRTIESAKELFGHNFIGPEAIASLCTKMGVSSADIQLPKLPYSLDTLEAYADNYLLIPGWPQVGGVPFSIAAFRKVFGVDPALSEPCFYNQDWYLQEDFIHRTLVEGWYLIRKEVYESSRALQPAEILKSIPSFPSAILCTYTFLAYYYQTGTILWRHDFIWCSDTDHNGDRIYVGKYQDVDGMNKNGFSIHRHLALRDCYAAIDTVC